ncbi:ABC transporter substrate-binding protein [Vagococcus intermedius]|uniref:Extracellular solute-binding protein n=1 Tax=Vagococcus intermedius TaxID=2991418 RepID=A0AAF0CTK6_9ENTE|nr:extracellular solute-binding protein [Vagococcus intermedius]WEG72597.1 extracellular solute-binding protein [Vagococcus intermedius]WEG74683.1 extracellular solute-binding protein [Vagococcus intermedius]
MKRRNKVMMSALALTTSVLLLGACGKGENKKSATGKDQEAITLEMWLTPQWKGVLDDKEEKADYDSFFKEAAKRYEEKNPNVHVNVQVIPGEQRADKLSVAVQTKELPDMFFDSSFALSEYAHMGVLAPLDDIIDEKSQKDIPKSIWENVQINDKTYFYPFAHNPGTLSYNAEMFKEAGLEKYMAPEYEIANWSSDDLKVISKKLKETNQEVAPFGLFAKNNQGDTWNMSYLRMFGNQFFDKDGKINVNDETGVKALEFLDDMRKDGLTTKGVETLSSNDVNAMFQNKQTAINFTNSVLFNGIKSDMASGKVAPFDMRLANIPGKDQPVSFTYVTSSVVFDSGDEARIKAAKDFVKFYSTDKELVKASKNALPVRDSVATEFAEDMPYLKAYQDNSENIINFSNNTPGYVELRNAFFPELQAVYTGEKTAQEALNSFAENGNRIIDENTKKSVILN